MTDTIRLHKNVINADINMDDLRIYVLLLKLQPADLDEGITLTTKEFAKITGFSEKKIQRAFARMSKEKIIRVQIKDNYFRTVYPLYGHSTQWS